MNSHQKLVLLYLLQLLLAAAEMQIIYCLALLGAEKQRQEDVTQIITTLIQSGCPNCDGPNDELGRFWVKPHQEAWWEYVVKGVGNENGEMSENDFIINFRVSREVFKELEAKLSPGMRKMDTRFRTAIPMDKRIAISLAILSSCSELKWIASLFGVGVTTVHEIFDDFIDTASTVLVPELIKWPRTTEEIETKAAEYEKIKHFPMVVASIDGCHIPVTPPKLDATEYYNFKGWYSIVTMALCDARGRAMYVKSGIPGRVHDSAIWKGTKLYRKILDDQIFPTSSRIINGVKIPYLILGDSAFQLTTWMMKPYVHKSALTSSQKNYNKRLSKARVAVEHLFGRVKGRWRRIAKRMDVDIHRVSSIVNVAFALHNLCESRNVDYNEDWNDDRLPQPELVVADTNVHPTATEIQDALRTYFDANPVID